MPCRRCHGLMVPITLKDVGGSSLGVAGRQCLLCGDIVDAGITANRKSHRDPSKHRARLPGTGVARGGARTRVETGL